MQGEIGQQLSRALRRLDSLLKTPSFTRESNLIYDLDRYPLDDYDLDDWDTTQTAIHLGTLAGASPSTNTGTVCRQDRLYA